MRARWWRLAALGLLLLGSCVAFFVVTSVRDARLLRDGTRVTATVVGHRPVREWFPLDEGRVIVRYPTPEGELTRQIWLDDAHNAPPTGATWTVVYDPGRPGRVRSLTDSNDPVPWAPPMLLLGLAGLILLVLGTAKGLTSRMAVTAAAAGCIPVRRYRLFSWPAWIDVADGTVRIRLPGYFGARPMVIPIDEVCVVDLRRTSAEYHLEGVYQRPLLIPYFITTSQWLGPNLTLFFTRPVRLPPLRRLGAFNTSLSRRDSRSEEGLAVDGLSLRVVDPAGAVTILAAAGVSQTQRPGRWLHDHHPVTLDPIEIRRATRSDRRWRWIGGLGLLGFGGLNGLRAVHSGWAAGIALSLAAILVLLPRWRKSRDRRDRTAELPTEGRHRTGRHS
jgi:hypothetical protein